MEPTLLWLAGYGVALIGFAIKFYIDHVRLKDRVCNLEKDYDVDMKELKRDVKELKADMNEMKIDVAEIKTLISGKTVQL